ncbi:MAG TPA: SWIM zinc finger family protein [Candidatus Paceibacterota bacterium]|nr:SWIM zinc finger family protein [Verrucomicrobiota bacterium]HRY49458.1 SWIM zinc finger family protein [Candidatus Paceibacterota bacterium]
MSRYDNGYYGWRPYVSVAERRLKAQREMSKLAKKGKVIKPVRIDGRTIARTFWGKAWCDNLESYMDYANRLPRGRTYLRNGSVVHLDIHPGVIEATVSGSELYQVKIQIAAAAKTQWKKLCHECAGAIGSLVELLQGRFSDHVMSILTRKETGLFPSPKEIQLKCSCPDWATMCKHVAAVLYGVGARLDENPEMLFTLRSVNHEELITQAASATDLATATGAAGPELAESEISDVFGIELDTQTPAATPPPPAETASTPPPPARRKRKPTPKTKTSRRQAKAASPKRKPTAYLAPATAMARSVSAKRKRPNKRVPPAT